MNPIVAQQGESVNLMSAVQKIPGMIYTFFENDDKTGKIDSIITYEPPQDTYYVAAGNGYCEGPLNEINIKVPCPPSVSDEAGVEYKVTYLAGLCWTENLRTTKYPGTDDDIPFANPYTCADCPEKLDTIYGLLYTWHSAVGATEADPQPNPQTSVQGICPAGWRIPTQAEWNLLNNYSAQQLQSTEYWLDPPGVGTDDFGFDARPAGWYNGSTDRFEDLYGFAGWWACDAPAGTTANYSSLHYYCTTLQQDIKKRSDGLSVRCVKE
jgi:uncharacterized protein (TIGR02145 family)